jgi:acyl-coenzyme A synthetase/AMP-(fatty) acid ligase
MSEKPVFQAAPLSRFTPSSRPAGTVLCYDRAFGNGVYKTWGDFLNDTALLRSAITAGNREQWILYSEDNWFFLCGLAALLQCKKQVLLTANIAEEYLKEIRTAEIAMISDRDLPGAVNIQAVLAGGESPPADEEPPAINADETVIIMYTSGTTGRPKEVRQRLTEFEADNAFVLSRWGKEFCSRRLCSTVSPHHIYGFLFSILLPFTAAVPFRRRQIHYPEEFEELTDDSYMIITVPAFLKRSVEIESAPSLALRSPYIFTSGGVLEREIAEKTREVFGFWPVEVYGSTETSGIAWRQSRDGPEWTPFDNARVRLNAEGYLVINSPYIRDPAGFTTGDLAEILEDGRFLLKGRVDSIVKIEEKRISLPEVEARLLGSGLVTDACVLAMRDKRQYLAAALVLNAAGREKFRDTEKFEINRYFRQYLGRFFEALVIPRRWRYLEKFPVDSQGKKKRLDIQALFGEDTLGGSDAGL